jgi:hypothetical protein
VLFGLLGAACSEPTPPISHGPSTSAGSTAAPTFAPFTTAQARPDDALIHVQPAMNGPGSPCAGVAVTTPLLQVDSACLNAWARYSVPAVPGEDLLQKTGIATDVRVQAGTDTSNAGAAATAYIREAVLERWAFNLPDIDLVHAITNPTSDDPPLRAMTQDYAVVSVPACWLPTTMRVVTLASPETTFFQSRGFTSATGLAIVATFPPCSGIVVSPNKPGATVHLYAQAKADSVVISGRVDTLKGVGAIWLANGYLGCGNPELAKACGRG